MDPRNAFRMPHANPSVTTIIPAHNRLHCLPAAIDSVLAQTLPVQEIIVVDDGSTDGTLNWISAHYPTVTLVSQANHGVSHARNRAIERATGEWIALLDSDDRWYPQKIERQLAALQENPALRLCHTDEHWIRNGKRVNPKHKHQKYGGDVFEHCLPLCAISPSAALLHRSLFDDVGLFDESLPACEDYDLWLRITAREPVLYVDSPLVEKTGGHDDQLSRRFPAMDRFRLKALARLLRDDPLTPPQRAAALATFQQKFIIYRNGAIKRQRHDEVQSLLKMYSDLQPPSENHGTTLPD